MSIFNFFEIQNEGKDRWVLLKLLGSKEFMTLASEIKFFFDFEINREIYYEKGIKLWPFFVNQ